MNFCVQNGTLGVSECLNGFIKSFSISAPPSDSGGLAPPPPNDSNATTPDPNAEEATPEEKGDEDQTPDGDASKPKKVWLDFEQFCKCFK